MEIRLATSINLIMGIALKVNVPPSSTETPVCSLDWKTAVSERDLEDDGWGPIISLFPVCGIVGQLFTLRIFLFKAYRYVYSRREHLAMGCPHGKDHQREQLCRVSKVGTISTRSSKVGAIDVQGASASQAKCIFTMFPKTNTSMGQTKASASGILKVG